MSYSRTRLYLCPRCTNLRLSRSFTAVSHLQSGHNRWSKIRHDKAKTDVGKNKVRTALADEIYSASKLFGPDPGSNPRLATAIARAKKEQFPKASIETAIARGQGISPSGAKLESVVVEAMVPPSVALIVDAQTDNKSRALQDVRTIISKCGGQVSPVGYLFEKKGEIVFKAKEGVGVDDILDSAIEAGATDLEEGLQGRLVVYSETNAIKAIAERLSREFGLDVESSEIIWDPTTSADLDSSDSATQLITLADKLSDIAGVQGIYMNAAQGAVPDDLWDQLQSRVFA